MARVSFALLDKHTGNEDKRCTSKKTRKIKVRPLMTRALLAPASPGLWKGSGADHTKLGGRPRTASRPAARLRESSLSNLLTYVASKQFQVCLDGIKTFLVINQGPPPPTKTHTYTHKGLCLCCYLFCGGYC